MQVVKSIRTEPLLTDIVGQLRMLADRIELGEQQADASVTVIYFDGDDGNGKVQVFHHGISHESRAAAIGLLYRGMHGLVAP